MVRGPGKSCKHLRMAIATRGRPQKLLWTGPGRGDSGDGFPGGHDVHWLGAWYGPRQHGPRQQASHKRQDRQNKDKSHPAEPPFDNQSRANTNVDRDQQRADYLR